MAPESAPATASSFAIEIDIRREHEAWYECDFDIDSAIAAAVKESLVHQEKVPNLKSRDCEISFVLADDVFIRGLNAAYRQKDKATNVLSFPQHDFFGPDRPDGDGPLSLGDVILAYETIAAEAADQNKSFHDHFMHLVVHGTLHLLGYDHENEIDAEIMEKLEISLLNQLDIENPYSAGNFMQ